MATWKKIALATGTSTQFIKGDGTLDSSTYLTSITSTNVTTALGYTPVTNARTLTINGVGYDLTANRSWTITSASSIATLSDVDLTGLANGQLLKYDSVAVLWKAFTPNYLTSAVTGVTGTAPVVSSGGNTPVISMAAASSGVNGYMTGTYATKLDGIATSANNYVHPSGDGNLHVPATGVSSTGKVLTAGETANSASWQPPSMSYSGLTGTVPTWNQSTTGNAATATTAGSSVNFMSTSHAGSYWLVNNWTGTHWQITSNHSAGVRVAYADSATNFNNGTSYSSGNSIFTDTLEPNVATDWLELTYYNGAGVRIGTGVNGSRPLYAGSLYDAGNRVYSAGNPQVNITGTSAGVSSGTVLCSVFDHTSRNGGQITTGNAGYLHLGQWGAGRTAPGTVLVNTAYTADYAGSVPYSGLTGTVPTWNQNTTGNAATATTASNLAANTSPTIQVLNFTGVGTNSGNATQSYAIYQEGGAWAHPYPDLRIAFHTGIKLGANAGYNGIRFYNDYDMVTETFSVGNGDNHVRVANNLYASGNIQAPIFYDSNNTNYYLDPNSTTSLRTVGDWRADSSAWSGEFSGKIQYHSNHWYIQAADLLIYRNSGGTNVFTVNQSGSAVASADMRAPIFYDSNDTGYYLDPNGTSNLYKLSEFTMAYNGMNPMSANSPYAARYGGSAQYRNGTMGYGTVDLNVIFSNWGSGFIDSWSSPANAPGGSSHYVGLQGFHYNHQNNLNAYGFQMACAGEADNRFFWRSAWPSLRSWVEMIHSGTIGSQSVSYASTAGNANNITAYTINQSLGTGNSPTFTDIYAGQIVASNWLRTTGHTGVYSNTYGSHFRPNTGEYGNWDIYGNAVNGWNGLRFSSVDSSLMIASNESGIHRAGYGWQFRWNNGILYCHKNAYGGGTAAAVIDSTTIGSQSVSYASSAGSAPANGGTSSNTNSISNAVGNSYTWTSTNYFRSNNNTASGNSYPLQAYSDNASGAVMSFHRSGQYAVNMGLDSDNVFRIGGWSAPANLLTLTMSGTLSVLEDFFAARNYATDYHYSYGNIYAQGTINAYWSDDRLKTKVSNITNALSKVSSLNGFYYTNNELANSFGYTDKDTYVGLSAQEVQNVLPEIVKIAPFDMDMDTKLSKSGENYMTIQYERIVPLLIEAIKELKLEIDLLKARIN